MTRSTRLAAVMGACVALSVGACGSDDEGGGKERGGWGGRGGGADEGPSAVVVEIEPVSRGDVIDVLEASATVEAEASADLMPAATGMVVRLAADVGDAVAKGDLLAVIDNVSLDAGAERARAEVRHLEARLVELEGLASSGAVSVREVEDLRYQLAAARTTLREASATQGETRLTAPFEGLVAARDVRVGEQVSSATRAFRIVDLSVLTVRASLPERDIGRVAVGQTATLVSAYDPDLTDRARVTRIAPVIDAASGTFQVTLTLDDRPEGAPPPLRPGQFVSVQLEVDRHEDVLVVPREAVLYDNGDPVVFRMTDPPEEPEDEEGSEAPDAEDEGGGGLWSWFGGGGSGEDGASDDGAAEGEGEDEHEAEDAPPPKVAERVAVDLGLVDARLAEITGGLDEGDPILVVGHTNLEDGAPVRLPRTDEEAEAIEAAAATEGDADGEEG